MILNDLMVLDETEIYIPWSFVLPPVCKKVNMLVWYVGSITTKPKMNN